MADDVSHGKAPLKIALISDGRAGHYRLSEGIVAAIARRRSVKVQRVDVRRGHWPGVLVGLLSNAHVPPQRLLSLVYGLDSDGLPASDLIVSAGAETLAANVALSRLAAAPNIYYGSLRNFAATDFRLVLTSYAANAGKPRHAYALKPQAMDPDAQPPVVEDPNLRPIAVLVGGEAPGIVYTPADWEALIAALTRLQSDSAITLSIANSRRTPNAVSDRLVEFVRSSHGRAHMIDVRAPGAPSLELVLARSAAVLCTVDSSSMVSEAIWARRKVVVLAPAICRLSANERAYRVGLVMQGLTGALAIGDLSLASLEAVLQRLTPLRENPQEALANLIGARLPALFRG